MAGIFGSRLRSGRGTSYDQFEERSEEVKEGDRMNLFVGDDVKWLRKNVGMGLECMGGRKMRGMNKERE